MALPPAIGGDIPDGDRKRLIQRADTFSIGSGTCEAKDREDVQGFDEALEGAGVAKVAKSPDEDIEKQAKETEDFREKQLLEQAEKRNFSGSASLNAFPGLLTLPGLGVPNLVIGENKRSESGRQSSALSANLNKELPTISQELAQKLREAGLEKPIESLNDPRLGKQVESLNAFFSLSIQDNKRVHFWGNKGCHQKITVGLHESRLESAAGNQVETIVRIGDTDEKSVATRIPPEESPFPEPT